MPANPPTLSHRRADLFAAFQAGVAAADPERAVSAALAAHPPALPARGGTLIAVGKAARKMT
ncbi:MAG: glycerate kinase, partial [Pseudomonadota bacterium]